MDERLVKLEEQLKHLGNDMMEMKDAVKDIAASLRSLTRLEEQHTQTTMILERVSRQIDDHEQRLRKIEEALPNMRLASGWVFRAALAIAGLLAAAAFKLAFFGGLS